MNSSAVFWSGTSLNELFNAASTEPPKCPAPWSAFLPAACANTKNCVNAASADGTAPCWTAHAAPCAPASNAKWMYGRVAAWPSLASVGSISPYVGLFGTVWGIMHAFTGLASLQQSVTLSATVAPGIAEALVATAIGLFAAIPAVRGLQPFLAPCGPHCESSWKPSLKSFPTSCSATVGAQSATAGHSASASLKGAPPCPAVASRDADGAPSV